MRSKIRKRNNQKGLSFIELMIILLLLTSAALIVILVLKPTKYIDRARDSRMMSELDKLKKVLEEYYNDKECYPKPTEICYNANSSALICNICGNEPSSPNSNFEPYGIKKLPCHFSHPSKKLLYEVDSTTCPTLFKIYLDFLDPTNPANLIYGCTDNGCGPASLGKQGYDYAVLSPNAKVEQSFIFFCFFPSTGDCRICGPSYGECYNNPYCGSPPYGTKDACESAN